LNIARIYCNRETQQAFTLMWLAFFQAVERVTGQKLLIKFIHKEGNLITIIMDGDAAQALGLGDALIKINEPDVSGILTKDPDDMLSHILWTCTVHCDR
jgi:hypothetical protein